MSDPWDIPPFPDRGDEDEDSVYRGVGYAMSEWERVEVELAELYTIAIERPNELQSIKDYGTPTNFDQRVTQLCTKTHAWFARNSAPQDLEAKFDELVRIVRGWAARRNDIAHGIVQPMHHQLRYIQQVIDEGRTRYALVPAFYTHRKHDMNYRPNYCYSAAELEAIVVGFFSARQAVAHFRRLISPDE